jgi:hypothetical protein
MELQFNLNAFNTCCIQVHKAKYSMNMQYPILSTLEIVWVPYHIVQQFEGYCIALPKPRRNAIFFIGPRNNTFFKVSQKYIGLYNIFLDT